MNPQILHFLENNRIGVLSIAMADGSVMGAALHFTHDNEPLTFFFSTDKNSRKGKVLSNGPVAASLVVGFSESEMATLQMEGQAQVVPLEKIKIAREIYYAKFPENRQYENDPDTLLISFMPKLIKLSDYKTDPPTIIS